MSSRHMIALGGRFTHVGVPTANSSAVHDLERAGEDGPLRAGRSWTGRS